MLGGQPVCGELDLQVFETLRDPDRLVRARKRRAEKDGQPQQQPAGKRRAVVAPKAAVAKGREALEEEYVALTRAYVKGLPMEVLSFKLDEMKKLVK